MGGGALQIEKNAIEDSKSWNKESKVSIIDGMCWNCKTDVEFAKLFWESSSIGDALRSALKSGAQKQKSAYYGQTVIRKPIRVDRIQWIASEIDFFDFEKLLR